MNLQWEKALAFFKNIKDFFQRISEELSEVKPFSKEKIEEIVKNM